MLCLVLCLIATATAADTDGSPGKLFLWEVTAQDGGSTYVMGSVHAARPELYPLPDLIEDAFTSARVLVVEVDVTDTGKLAKAAPLMGYTPPDGLDRHLRPATWSKVEALAQAARRDPAELRPIRPAFLAEVIALGALSRQGYDPHLGIDVHFLKQAHEGAKPIEELESLEFQLGVLSGLPDEDADMFLDETIEEVRNGQLSRDTEQLALAWKTGDVDSLARIIDEEGHRTEAARRLMRVLFDERNRTMADRIASLVKNRRGAFVVVGAGHLVGKDNVLDRLRRMGMRVRQLP